MLYKKPNVCSFHVTTHVFHAVTQKVTCFHGYDRIYVSCP